MCLHLGEAVLLSHALALALAFRFVGWLVTARTNSTRDRRGRARHGRWDCCLSVLSRLARRGASGIRRCKKAGRDGCALSHCYLWCLARAACAVLVTFWAYGLTLPRRRDGMLWRFCVAHVVLVSVWGARRMGGRPSRGCYRRRADKGRGIYTQRIVRGDGRPTRFFYTPFVPSSLAGDAARLAQQRQGDDGQGCQDTWWLSRSPRKPDTQPADSGTSYYLQHAT